MREKVCLTVVLRSTSSRHPHKERCCVVPNHLSADKAPLDKNEPSSCRRSGVAPDGANFLRQSVYFQKFTRIFFNVFFNYFFFFFKYEFIYYQFTEKFSRLWKGILLNVSSRKKKKSVPELCCLCSVTVFVLSVKCEESLLMM